MSPFSDTQQYNQELAATGDVILHGDLNITSCDSILKISIVIMLEGFSYFDFCCKLYYIIILLLQISLWIIVDYLNKVQILIGILPKQNQISSNNIKKLNLMQTEFPMVTYSNSKQLAQICNNQQNSKQEQTSQNQMNENKSVVISQVDEEEVVANEADSASYKPSCGIKFMIGYLYFMQGFILSIAGTVTYVYPQLPDYFTLSLFSLCAIPFSLKFLTAPILQKYSNISYGKRKTWIIGSQILTNIMIIICSFYTNIEYAKFFAFLAIFMYLGLSLQDISLDALCLKQLQSPKMMSMIQGACQSSGVIVGSLILLKGTSLQFAQSIGLRSPIANLQQILIGLSIIIFISTLLIHFRFTQTLTQAEQKTMKESIFRVYSIYRYYFKKEYRYCRVIVFLLFYYQGFNFFLAGYEYELIHAGFSRNTMNSIDNIQNIILTLLMFLLGTHANYFGYLKTFIVILTSKLVVFLYLWVLFPTSLPPIIITNFLLGFLGQWVFLQSTILSGDFPEGGATGMLYTMSASGANLGKNLFIHTAILKKVPWKTMSIIGLGLQALIILLYVPKMIGLIETGETKIQISKQDQDNHVQFSEQIQGKKPTNHGE